MEKMRRKNILLLWLDGLRADRLGCYGYNRQTTPTLDRLAKKGAVFLNNYSVSNCSIPAYFSAFTGLYPCVHKAASTSGYYDGAYPFLADLLRGAGYYTFGISNNVPAFSPEWGFVRGYDQFYSVGKIRNWFKASKDAQGGFNKQAMRQRLIGALNKYSPGFSDWARAKYARDYYDNHDMGGAKAVQVLSQVIDNLTRDQSKPFFGFVNIPDTHSPYIPPIPFRNKFGTPQLTIPLMLLNMFPAEFERRGMTLTKKEVSDLGLLYDGTVNYVDTLVNKILKKLEKHRVIDDTVLVIFGDHGGNLFEKRGYIGAGSYTYQCEIKVPLIIVNADGLNGIHTQLTSITDIFPTLLEIAGIKMPLQPQYRCKNLFQDRQGHDCIVVDYPRWPDWILEHDPSLPGQFFVKYCITNRTLVRRDSWKLIWRSDGEHELFDIANDPNEESNLFGRDLTFSYEMIEQLKTAYCNLLGPSGSYLEIYDHHSVGPGMNWLPAMDIINCKFDVSSRVAIDNSDMNRVSSHFD